MEEKKSLISAELIDIEQFVNYLRTLKGVAFVGLREYENEFNEVANHVINVNPDVSKQKQKDLDNFYQLRSDGDKLTEIALKHAGGDIIWVNRVLNGLIESAEKNLFAPKEEKTKQSQAQTNAYEWLCQGIKRHKETKRIFVVGLPVSKTILVEGVYPEKTGKIQKDTPIKNALRYAYGKQHNTYKQFEITKIRGYRFAGGELVIE